MDVEKPQKPRSRSGVVVTAGTGEFDKPEGPREWRKVLLMTEVRSGT